MAVLVRVTKEYLDLDKTGKLNKLGTKENYELLDEDTPTVENKLASQRNIQNLDVMLAYVNGAVPETETVYPTDKQKALLASMDTPLKKALVKRAYAVYRVNKNKMLKSDYLSARYTKNFTMDSLLTLSREIARYFMEHHSPKYIIEHINDYNVYTLIHTQHTLTIGSNTTPDFYGVVLKDKETSEFDTDELKLEVSSALIRLAVFNFLKKYNTTKSVNCQQMVESGDRLGFIDASGKTKNNIILELNKLYVKNIRQGIFSEIQSLIAQGYPADDTSINNSHLLIKIATLR